MPLPMVSGVGEGAHLLGAPSLPMTDGVGEGAYLQGAPLLCNSS